MALYLIATGVFKVLNIVNRTQRLFLLNLLTVSLFQLRTLLPYIGSPTEAGPMVNTLLFYHLVILAVLGVFLSCNQTRFIFTFLHIFKTPFLYVLFAGLLFAGFSVSLPYIALEAIDTLFSVTAPLALLVIGVVLGKYIYLIELDKYTFLIPGLILCSFLRLIISPLIAGLLVMIMGIEDSGLQRALVFSSGLPTGIFAGILVALYGQSDDKRFTLFCILFTNLLCWGSFPLLVIIVNRVFPV